MSYRREELLIATIAGLLDGTRHVAVGANSPIPAAAALLARRRSRGDLRVSLLGSERHSFFTDGARELFDCAAQGRINAFFLGGAQIDGAANINLVGIGGYPHDATGFPGSFGSAYLYFSSCLGSSCQPDPHTAQARHGRIHQRPRSEPAERVPPGSAGRTRDRTLRLQLRPQRGPFRAGDRPPRRDRCKGPRADRFRVRRARAGAGDPEPDAETLAAIRGEVAAALAGAYPVFAEQVLGPPA